MSITKIMEKGKLEKPTLDYDDGEEEEVEICVTLKMVMIMKLIAALYSQLLPFWLMMTMIMKLIAVLYSQFCYFG